MANDSIITYSDLIGDDGTFDDLIKDIKKLEKELLDLAKTSKKAFANLKPDDIQGMEKLEKTVKEIEQGKKNLIKTEKALQKAKKKTIDLTNEELVQREAIKLENRERIQRAKQLAIIAKEEKNTIASLRAQLALTTLDWKKFTAEEIKTTKEGKKALKNKKDLTKQLKKLEKATGDNRRNVGNYKSALSGLNGVMVGFGGNIGMTVGALRSMGGVMKALVTSLKTFKGALIGTGIGALVVAFGALVTFLTRTQRGLDFVNQAFAAVTTTIDVIIDRISKFGEAIGLAFRGEFAKAADKFKESVAGVTTEIKEEAAAAIALEKALQAQVAAERILRLEKAKAGLQIAELLRKAEESKNKNKKLSEEQLREALAIQQKISDAEVKFAKETLRITQAKIALGETLNNELSKEVDQKIAVLAADKAREDAIRGITRKLNSLTGAQKDNTKEIEANTKAAEDNATKRIKAIESLTKLVKKLEAEGKEDLQEQSLELEKLRFKEEQALRKANFDEIKALSTEQDKDLGDIKKANDRAAELQAEQHQENLLEIRKKYAIKTIEIEALTQEQIAEQKQKEFDDFNEKNGINIDQLKENQKTITDEFNKGIQDRKKAQEEAAKDTFKKISQSAQKVGELISDVFQRQADLSGESVNEQVQNLERAQDRLSQGLKANLVFEEQELAKRQSEQQAKQKEAEQAAKILALFNLVSAYAASGDKNALSRGLVDWSLMTALSAGFEEGGYTGDEGQKAIAGVVHGQEFVVTAKDTARFNLRGKSGDEFGEAMSDYYTAQSPITQNPYKEQRESFRQGINTVNIGNSEVVKEIKGLRKEMASQPNYSAQIVKSQEDVISLLISEQKKGMRKLYTKIMRAKK